MPNLYYGRRNLEMALLVLAMLIDLALADLADSVTSISILILSCYIEAR